MSATAALSAASVAEIATPGTDRFTQLTITLALTTGIAAAVAGLLRLGFLANYISEPVLKGFIVGLALTIIVGQLPKLFGAAKGSGDFFEQLWHLLGGARRHRWADLARRAGLAWARARLAPRRRVRRHLDVSHRLPLRRPSLKWPRNKRSALKPGNSDALPSKEVLYVRQALCWSQVATVPAMLGIGSGGQVEGASGIDCFSWRQQKTSFAGVL